MLNIIMIEIEVLWWSKSCDRGAAGLKHRLCITLFYGEDDPAELNMSVSRGG